MLTIKVEVEQPAPAGPSAPGDEAEPSDNGANGGGSNGGGEIKCVARAIPMVCRASNSCKECKHSSAASVPLEICMRQNRLHNFLCCMHPVSKMT